MKMIQDRGTICENKETQILEDSHKLDNRLESDLVILEVDETWDTEGIQNQETLDLDKVSVVAESPSGLPYLNPDSWSFAATNDGGKTGSRNYS